MKKVGSRTKELQGIVSEKLKEIGGGSLFAVDLRPHCNAALGDPAVTGTPNDLRQLPVGKQTFRGVTFDIIDQKRNNGNSYLRLLSTKHAGSFPRQITGIKAGGKKASKLFFLHAMEWGDEHPSPAKAGEYRIHYQGQAAPAVVPIENGKTVIDWWAAKMPSDAPVAWFADNGNALVCVYVYPWTNPHPDWPIETIDFVSDDVGPVLSLIAVTGEE